ncbi:MAG: hypothetical protein WC985_04835 [Thermoplasmata archaeon]
MNPSEGRKGREELKIVWLHMFSESQHDEPARTLTRDQAMGMVEFVVRMEETPEARQVFHSMARREVSIEEGFAEIAAILGIAPKAIS